MDIARRPRITLAEVRKILELAQYGHRGRLISRILDRSDSAVYGVLRGYGVAAEPADRTPDQMRRAIALARTMPPPRPPQPRKYSPSRPSQPLQSVTEPVAAPAAAPVAASQPAPMGLNPTLFARLRRWLGGGPPHRSHLVQLLGAQVVDEKEKQSYSQGHPVNEHILEIRRRIDALEDNRVAGPKLLTIQEVSERLSLGRSSVCKLLGHGLTPIKIGGAVRIYERDLEAFILALVSSSTYDRTAG